MKYELAVIGTSLGGLQSLSIILSGFPKSLPIAIAIVQHRHISSASELVNALQQYSLLPIIEAEDKLNIVAGNIYLAPANYHLLVELGHFALSTEAPVCYARPSIDVLFETAADAYLEQVIGVILTGANHDGARGLAKIEAYGGFTIVQEPSTAICSTMPKAAITAVPKAKILPLTEIAPFLINLCSNAHLTY
ncbi:CheB methylesterase [Rivularia sp. IAM M-261]|nr:CheB methylesterase [Calothrix sp. PCC 7716]GJD23780.1 CheB methylesterase [Rivularia sp. IAM M-261]